MSRRVIKEEFDLFDKYAETKLYLDTIKKEEAEMKDLIKDKLIQTNNDCIDRPNYKITLSKTEKNDLDKDKLMKLLLETYKESDLIDLGILEVKTVINEEVLENKIYEQVIDGALLSECIIEKAPVYTLRVKYR